jgi:hypothetical protein
MAKEFEGYARESGLGNSRRLSDIGAAGTATHRVRPVELICCGGNAEPGDEHLACRIVAVDPHRARPEQTPVRHRLRHPVRGFVPRAEAVT